MSRVAPAERDLVTLQGDESVIGYSHAMGVGAEIPQHLIGPPEWRLTVRHPAQTMELMDQAPEELGLNQSAEYALKHQFSGGVRLLEGFEEFPAEGLAENAFREEEARAARAFPVSVIRRQTSGGDHTVNVRVMLELLIPGVQHTEETDLGAEMPGISGNLYEGLRATAKQQTVHHLFVLQGQWCQLVGQRKDNVSVGCTEQLGASRRQPAVARLSLAFWTMPVSARVVGDGLMAAG